MRSRFNASDGTTDRSRSLRREASPAEKALWAVLRNAQLGGCKFRRQQRIGPYFADFACQSAKLIVEVDGDSHADTIAYDERRTGFLEGEGYKVLRFDNADVLGNIEGVAADILIALRPSPSHSATQSGPLPLPQGERDK